MRILLHDYAGHPFPIDLSRELARRGHEVVHAFASDLVTPRGNLERTEQDPAGLVFRSVPMSPDYRANKYNFVRRAGYERDYGLELAVVVRSIRPDIVLSGQTPSQPQLTLIRAAERVGIPVVTWVQDFYSLAVAKLAGRRLPIVGHLAGWWYRHLDRRCFRESSGIVAITEDFVPVLAGFGAAKEKISVIPNWAPLGDLPPRQRYNEWAARHGLIDRFVFLYSGTLAMKHNPDLLRRLAIAFAHDRSVQVVVISEGPGAEWLRERKQVEQIDNLQLLGFQPLREMPEALAAADVLLAVLEKEAGVFSVPSKVLAYLAAGRPTLAAMPRENLASRILAQSQSGICVVPGDVDVWLAAAAGLRGDEMGRARMGRRAREFAEREFAIGAIADRFENVFARAKASSGRPD